jgi:hypothetical protein
MKQRPRAVDFKERPQSSVNRNPAFNGLRSSDTQHRAISVDTDRQLRVTLPIMVAKRADESDTIVGKTACNPVVKEVRLRTYRDIKGVAYG